VSIRIYSASIQGIDAQPIEVEVDSSPGLHVFNIVGLPDKAVEESRDRIASAIRNSGLTAPNSKNRKIIVNLAPADVKKEGPAYDLPIAIGYLLETGQLKFNPSEKMFAGELSLDGSLKHTNGILSMALLAKSLGFKELIIPSTNAQEASVVTGVTIIGAKNMQEVVGHLNGTYVVTSTVTMSPVTPIGDTAVTMGLSPSLLFIRGQESAKRGLMIAAAGSHNVLMNGVPGSGKTLLAKAMAELLPPLKLEEALEVAKIYSSIGLIKGAPLSYQRPFRSPHHTTSAVAMVGGGSYPKAGEISLAHRGVLFLDELPEFPRNVLEALRQPLEDGVVTISRASGSLTMPAKFTLVAAMNPCPCGNYGDEKAECICSPLQISRYHKKLSGPLLDRIDIQLHVPREIVNQEGAHSNPADIQKIRATIHTAKEIQHERFKGHGIYANAEINYKNIDTLCIATPEAEALLTHAVNAKGLSLRAYHKIKKLARTIADLEASDTIKEHHIAEALTLRIRETPTL
jgi:magnesium chelatase family protein